MIRVDGRRLRPATGSLDAYMAVRNEADRLPYMLDHHAAAGVDRFFVVDNGSDDGTLEILLSRPDCFVYRTDASFAEAGCGMAWINALVAEQSDRNWCLFLDADELFVHPHAETASLRTFCRFLDARGDQGVFALMIDMYGAGPVAATHYRPGTPFTDTCPFFDGEYAVRRKAGLPFSRRFHDVEGIGGPRLRLFYPELREAGIRRLAVIRAWRALRQHRLGRWLGGGAARSGALPPDVTKIPLMKGGDGRRWASNHRTTPLALSPVTGALLHFKFFADFDRRARIEAARGEHWNGGQEYVRYADLLARTPDLTFVYPGSRVYRSSADLVRAGIVRSTAEWDAWAGSRATGKAPAASVSRPAMRRGPA